MYVLAKDEGSPKLGSMLAKRVSSVMDVWSTDKLRDEDILAAKETLVKTELRNSEVWEVMTGLVTDVEEGIRWGKVSWR